MEIKLADFTFVRVGVLGRTKGVKGLIFCHFDDEFQDLEEDIEYIFLFDGGNPYPLKITDRQWSNGFLVRFGDKYSLEELKFISDNKVYVNKKDIPEELLEEFLAHEYSDLIGYSFEDENSNIGGIIDDILEYPHQFMVSTIINEKELLFPIHDEYIKEIDDEKEHITFDLPEGIFDINE